jgi:hypothetical protein
MRHEDVKWPDNGVKSDCERGNIDAEELFVDDASDLWW